MDVTSSTPGWLKTQFLVFLFPGYGAVGFENNPSYGHTASHHTPQLSSLPFKHEDALLQTNNLGSFLFLSPFNWLIVWVSPLSQHSQTSFFISQGTCHYLSGETSKASAQHECIIC